MDELKAKLKDICEMKENLVCWCKATISKGCESICESEVELLGDTIDMIKDLAETEEKCVKACYYKKIIEAMEEEKKEEELRVKMGIHDDGKMGYNHRHYASGRFAPSGRRTRMGFHIDEWPDETDREMAYNHVFMENPHDFHRMMGYTDSDLSGSSGYDHDMSMSPSHYDQFQQARRSYTETKSTKDYSDMTKYGDTAVTEAIDTVRDIYQSADPEMKKRLKDRMTKLLSEMP